MDIKPTTTLPTDKYLTFGITIKKPIKKVYYPNCWNEVSEGKIKDYSFTIYNNYEFGRKCSTLIILKKLGTWLKSKLKYKDVDGQRKVLWSHR
jgi:hypothetical protein